MASLDEIYGINHEQNDAEKRAYHIIDTLASTLAEMLELRLDTTVLWENKKIVQKYRDYLIKKINQVNENIFLTYADCDTVHSLPYYIKLPMVEYFILIDAKNKRQCVVFISPDQMGIM